jgi:hypothetical protein
MTIKAQTQGGTSQDDLTRLRSDRKERLAPRGATGTKGPPHKDLGVPLARTRNWQGAGVRPGMG